ncbi:MAG: hypothetical protein OXC12_04045 [Spirochaetaceae bacterium]|nr:hypothetical protein [Spirochaetaceae bacterium]
MAQQTRQQVSIRREDWEKAQQLRDEFTAVSGGKFTITDTIGKALQYLEGALSESSWPSLTAKIEAEIMVREERFRREVISVLSQFIARAMPERTLRKVTFEHTGVPGTGGVVMVVHLDDRAVPLFMWRMGMVERTPVESDGD